MLARCRSPSGCPASPAPPAAAARAAARRRRARPRPAATAAPAGAAAAAGAGRGGERVAGRADRAQVAPAATGWRSCCCPIRRRPASATRPGSASARATRTSAAGETGLAHLFEHLMFTQTKNDARRRVRSRHRGGGRQRQRDDLLRLHRLRRRSAAAGAGAGGAPGGRSDDEPGSAQAPGRHRARRRRRGAAVVGRGQRRRHDGRADVQAGLQGPPLPLAGDRLDEGHQGDHAGEGGRVLQALLRAEQRRARHRREASTRPRRWS